jgi:hypothetical protein
MSKSKLLTYFQIFFKITNYESYGKNYIYTHKDTHTNCMSLSQMTKFNHHTLTFIIKKSKMFSWFHIFVLKDYVLKTLKHFSNKLSKQLFVYFQIEIEPNSRTYICTSFFYNINEDKQPLHQVSNEISRNTIIPLT